MKCEPVEITDHITSLEREESILLKEIKRVEDELEELNKLIPELIDNEERKEKQEFYYREQVRLQDLKKNYQETYKKRIKSMSDEIRRVHNLKKAFNFILSSSDTAIPGDGATEAQIMAAVGKGRTQEKKDKFMYSLTYHIPGLYEEIDEAGIGTGRFKIDPDDETLILKKLNKETTPEEKYKQPFANNRRLFINQRKAFNKHIKDPEDDIRCPAHIMEEDVYLLHLDIMDRIKILKKYEYRGFKTHFNQVVYDFYDAVSEEEYKIHKAYLGDIDIKSKELCSIEEWCEWDNPSVFDEWEKNFTKDDEEKLLNYTERKKKELERIDKFLSRKGIKSK